MYVYVSSPTVWDPSVSITEQIVIERIWVTLDSLLCVICIRRCESLLGSISLNWHINIEINITTPQATVKCEIYLDTLLLNHARAPTHIATDNYRWWSLKLNSDAIFHCFVLLCVNIRINICSVSKCLLSWIWLMFHKVYRLPFNDVILFWQCFHVNNWLYVASIMPGQTKTQQWPLQRQIFYVNKQITQLSN